MDKIKTVKIKMPDGSVSEETYTISVDAKDVDMKNGKDLQDTIGDINVDRDGNIAEQLKNKVDVMYIEDDLISDETDKALSANQGRVLKNITNELNIDIQKKVYYYDTIADMKADTKLKNGDMAATLGYYSINDGGNGEYKIVNGIHIDDGGSYHKLNNNLFAELVPRKGVVNVNQFGAYGDGVHDDTENIQKAINLYNNVECCGNCTYIVNGVTINKFFNLNGNGCTFKASLLVDYILQTTTTTTDYHGIIEKINFDGNFLALDCVLNNESFRRTFKNLSLNNPRDGGSGFHQINRGGGTRLESINGYQVRQHFDTTFLKIEGADVNANMLDFIGYKTGLYCNAANIQINQFHGFIFSRTDVRVYENSKFIHCDGGKLTAFNVYPDTQQFWFYFSGNGDFNIIGGTSWHNTIVGSDIIEQTALQKGYVVFTTSPSYVRRLHLNNLTIASERDFDYIDFCNTSAAVFDTTGTSTTADSPINFLEWLATSTSNRVERVITLLNDSYYTSNLRITPKADLISISGSITFNSEEDFTNVNYVDIFKPTFLYDFTDNTGSIVFGAYVGTDINNSTGATDIKWSLNTNGTCGIRKLMATSLAGKTIFIDGYIYLKQIH